MSGDNAMAPEQALQEALAARAEAEAALAAKSDLLATVSHELRTPMGAIISMADLLQVTALDGTQRRYADTLQQSARSLLVLLNDILDFEKLDSGHFTLNPQRVDLGAFLEKVETALAARAGSAGLEAQVVRDSDLPAAITADPIRLRQILDNLIDNAVKYTPSGSVTVAARFEETGANEGILTLAVADTGIGISEADRRRLFKPYVQAAPASDRAARGTGLGLSIIARLVALMGGTVGCDSTLGKGSTFSAALPCELPAPEAVASKPNGADDAKPALRPSAPAPLNLLVVEDNNINQILIGALLENFGMRYTVAGSGPEALKALAKADFDLVLMDVRMPGMDGLEATRRIRTLDGPAAAIPIIAITAQALADDEARVLAAGMNGYVTKPIEPRTLYEEILAAIGGERDASPAKVCTAP